jgi:hypothetical protein
MYISSILQRNISQAMVKVVNESELQGKEFSGVICVDPKTDEVKSIKVLYIGTVNTSMLNFDRICSNEYIQITFHTHPTQGGGLPKFSKQDYYTIDNRLNNKTDDASCVASPYGITCRTDGALAQSTDDTLHSTSLVEDKEEPGIIIKILNIMKINRKGE